MAKLGLRRHRFTVAALSWLYVISAVFILLYSIIKTCYASLLVTSFILLIVGCFGIYALYKENGTLMQINGVILISIVIVHVLATIKLLVCMFTRETYINDYMVELMDKYYESVDAMERVDEIQKSFECCGRESFNEWVVKPQSCCETFNCSTYYTAGCVDALSPYSLYIFIGLGLICVGSIILHVCAVFSAFALARVYRRA